MVLTDECFLKGKNNSFEHSQPLAETAIFVELHLFSPQAYHASI